MTGGTLIGKSASSSQATGGAGVTVAAGVPTLAEWAAVRIKRYALDVVLWALMFLLLWSGFAGMAAFGSYYPPISLRYDEPITGQAAYNALRYAADNTSEEMFWPTFWSESSVRLESEFVSAQTDCLWYSGQGALVWPEELVAGAWPGATDLAGCVLTEALAWELFGSTNVVGMVVEVDGEAYTVQGVAKGEEVLAVLPTDERGYADGWQAVELAGGPAGSTRDDAEAFAATAGLGSPNNVLMGEGISFLASVMAILPVVILAGSALLIWLFGRKRRRTVWGIVTGFCLLGIFILSLPSLLELLPAWLVPSRWSDFSFWTGLGEQLTTNVREFFATVPRLRDVEGKMLLMKQAAVFILSVVCTLLLCFRMKGKMAFGQERTGEQNRKYQHQKCE